jgi:phosphatidate cytidylyltransferase
MLRQRLLLGPVLLGALFLVFWIDQRFGVDEQVAHGARWFLRRGFALLVLGLVVTPFAAWELKQLFRALGMRVSRAMLIAGACVGMVLAWGIPGTLRPLTAFMLVSTAAGVVLFGALVWHSRTRTSKGVLVAAGAALLSFVYFGLMFGFVLALRREHAAWVVLGVLVLTKSCDIGAYFTGKTIGKHKLILWLSPGKTWEGLAGGILTAAALGVGFAWLVTEYRLSDELVSMTWWHGALLGAFLAITGQMGDLAQSLMKRDAGVKDSSSLVPGFGGVMDVIDSLLPAAPVAYWLLHRA